MNAKGICLAKKIRPPENRRKTGGKLANGRDPSVGKKTQFQPGHSGNPGGRPKRDEAAEIAKAIFEHNANEIYQVMLAAIKEGNPKVFTALADRGYGKAPQHISVGGTGSGGAVGLDVTIRFVKAKA